MVWASAADTWTSYAVIATADIDCLWCDLTHWAWQKGLHMADKAGVGEKNERVRNDLVMKQTNKQNKALALIWKIPFLQMWMIHYST